MTNSWLGDYEVVYRVLAEAGADFSLAGDESQVFLLDGSMTIGMGGKEVVVGPDVLYFINGEPHSLLEQLRTVDGGVMVGVI